MYYYWGMHGYWWIFWIFLWILFFFFYDAGEAGYLPANAIASAAPAKKICRRRDHRRGIRRTADQTPAGCEYEIGISTWRCKTLCRRRSFKPSNDAVQRTFCAAVTLRRVSWLLCSYPKPLNDWRNSFRQEPPCRSQYRDEPAGSPEPHCFLSSGRQVSLGKAAGSGRFRRVEDAIRAGGGVANRLRQPGAAGSAVLLRTPLERRKQPAAGECPDFRTNGKKR